MAYSDLEWFYDRSHITSFYGDDRPPRTNPHRGLDFGHPEGTIIPSWMSGVVVRSEWSSGLGWFITIKGIGPWEGLLSSHCHMKAKSPLAVGDTRVSQGTVLGQVGDTGSLSRGAHDHCTLQTSGTHPGTVSDAYLRDPLQPIMASRASTLGTDPVPIEPEEPESEYDMLILSRAKDNDGAVIPWPVFIRGGGWNHYVNNQDELDSFTSAMQNSGHKVPPIITVGSYTNRVLANCVLPRG